MLPLVAPARRRRRRAHDRRAGDGARRATASSRSPGASTTSPPPSSASHPSDLIFDALTFTLATGEAEWIDSATETIEGIRLIKRELPGVLTSLGVSNVSFGLTPDARAVLNSVFLHHCVAAGLDAAIVNPAHIRPYAEVDETERALADDLVFNRRPDALQRFIEHFARVGAGGSTRSRRPGRRSHGRA